MLTIVAKHGIIGLCFDTGSQVNLCPPHPKRNDQRRQAARAGGEATPPGARDDGTAAIAGTHHQVDCFPLSREPGALSPAHERGDAPQAKQQGLPQPGLDGSGAHGMKPAGVCRGATRGGPLSGAANRRGPRNPLGLLYATQASERTGRCRRGRTRRRGEVVYGGSWVGKEARPLQRNHFTTAPNNLLF
jgi:hypothetical protein